VAGKESLFSVPRSFAAHGSAALAKSIGRTMRPKAGIADLGQGRREPSWATAVTLAGALGVEVAAFLQQPAPRQQTSRGRPPKAAAAPAEQPQAKRPRGRPRKGK
jgi:hypothetical protein